MLFRSREFAKFLNAWGIKSTTSSPEYSQSNGQDERTIQTVKTLFKKAHDNGTDPSLSLLEFRNSPITGLKYSPAQVLKSRRLRAKLPMSYQSLKPAVVNVYHDLCSSQAKEKSYFDRSAKPLPVLKKGDKVRSKVRNRWNDGVICDVDDEPRSYLVKNAHGCIRRNRRHLHKLPQSYNTVARYDHIFKSDFEPSPPESAGDPSQPYRSRNANHDSQRVSFFGRTIRSPQQFNDYE